MRWAEIYMRIFGRTEFLGIDLGFWIALGMCLLVVTGMNLIFWGMRPQQRQQ